MAIPAKLKNPANVLDGMRDMLASYGEHRGLFGGAFSNPMTDEGKAFITKMLRLLDYLEAEHSGAIMGHLPQFLRMLNEKDRVLIAASKKPKASGHSGDDAGAAGAASAEAAGSPIVEVDVRLQKRIHQFLNNLFGVGALQAASALADGVDLPPGDFNDVVEALLQQHEAQLRMQGHLASARLEVPLDWAPPTNSQMESSL